jgi:phage gp36-like protein
MAYTSITDLEMEAGGAQALTELTDWDGDGDRDANVVEHAQAKADGWIDGYLRNRYEPLPIPNPSETLKRLAAEETIYWLKQARNRVGITEAEVMQRTDRERQLEQMRAGTLRPDAATTVPSTAGRSKIIAAEDTDIAVSRENLKGQW